MSFTCKRCEKISDVKTQRESICESCKIQLDLLDQELSINNKRIKKLEEHKKLELENPKNPETHLETIRRIEKNLKIEYTKRDGIVKTMNSKDSF